MKRLTDLETALWEAIGKVDRTKLAIKKLENENAEIRADIEAYKLIVSENKRIKLEVLKREKKCLRKLGVWEKQKKKLQDAIAAEMQNISDLQQQLVELEAAIKEAEVCTFFSFLFSVTVFALLLDKLGNCFLSF